MCKKSVASPILWCSAVLNFDLVIEIYFLFIFKSSSFSSGISGMYSKRSLVCTCKLAKLCGLRNIK